MPNFFHSIRKNLAILAIAAGAITVPAASAFAVQSGGEWKANGDDALLLDVRSGQWRVGDGVRGYQTDTGVCIDFGDLIMALDLPIRLDKKSRRATGWLFKENRIITLDRDLGVVQIVNKETRLAAQDIRDTPEGWCVDTRIMQQWLEDFAFRITPSPILFCVVGFGVLLIAMLITGYHSFKAALKNPVDVLKDE